MQDFCQLWIFFLLGTSFEQQVLGEPQLIKITLPLKV